MKHTCPETLPGDWLASFKMPSADGIYESFTVIKSNGSTNFHPFVVHIASYKDEGTGQGWFYHHGDYCLTRAEANRIFHQRTGA